MRHAIGLGVVFSSLVATGEALAAGNNGPPCRCVSWVRTGDMTTPRGEHRSDAPSLRKGAGRGRRAITA